MEFEGIRKFLEISTIANFNRFSMLLYIKAKPNSRFNKVEKAGEDWQIRLKAPAIDGKANEHLIEYLSEILKIPKSKITLKKGHTSRIKCLEIDLDEKEVLNRLELKMQSEK
jgi:uncharacterized protein